MAKSRWVLAAVILGFLVSEAALAAAGAGTPDDWFVPSSQKQNQAPPKQISSSETINIPPGPPAIPQNQTERKRDPSPEYLVGKVQWGQSASIGTATIQDWDLAGNDVIELVQRAKELGYMYHWAHTNLNEFDYDSKRLPALLISGVRILKFTPAQTENLRKYVLNGGMIICDSVYGSPHFYESSLAVFNEMFPESRFRVIPPDHPLYHMLLPIEKVKYACGPEHDKPFLEGIYVGSRIGVLLAKQGLGCGWEGKTDVFAKLIERGLKPEAYSVESARKIAQNLVAYLVGYAQVGQIEGAPEEFGLPDQKTPTAEFVLAQVKHEGAWNAHPGAARSLLAKLQQRSSIPVNLRRLSVDPVKDDLSPYPFLYFTGLDDFVLTPEAAAKLKAYVENGGTLLINNGLGLASFHQAVLREIPKLAPGKQLRQLAPDHPLFSSLHKITRVTYTPVLEKDKGAELKGQPYLFAVTFGDEQRARIVYSPYDLEAGWHEVYYPLVRGYDPTSAQQIGMNIIMYAMTH